MKNLALAVRTFAALAESEKAVGPATLWSWQATKDALTGAPERYKPLVEELEELPEARRERVLRYCSSFEPLTILGEAWVFGSADDARKFAEDVEGIGGFTSRLNGTIVDANGDDPRAIRDLAATRGGGLYDGPSLGDVFEAVDSQLPYDMVQAGIPIALMEETITQALAGQIDESADRFAQHSHFYGRLRRFAKPRPRVLGVDRRLVEALCKAGMIQGRIAEAVVTRHPDLRRHLTEQDPVDRGQQAQTAPQVPQGQPQGQDQKGGVAQDADTGQQGTPAQSKSEPQDNTEQPTEPGRDQQGEQGVKLEDGTVVPETVLKKALAKLLQNLATQLQTGTTSGQPEPRNGDQPPEQEEKPEDEQQEEQPPAAEQEKVGEPTAPAGGGPPKPPEQAAAENQRQESRLDEGVTIALDGGWEVGVKGEGKWKGWWYRRPNGAKMSYTRQHGGKAKMLYQMRNAAQAPEHVVRQARAELKAVGESVTEAAPRGRAQRTIIKLLGEGPADLTDLAARPALRGVHFAQVMRSVEALEKKGLVRVNGQTIMLAEAELTEARAFSDIIESVYLFLSKPHKWRDISRHERGVSGNVLNDVIDLLLANKLIKPAGDRYVQSGEGDLMKLLRSFGVAESESVDEVAGAIARGAAAAAKSPAVRKAAKAAGKAAVSAVAKKAAGAMKKKKDEAITEERSPAEILDVLRAVRDLSPTASARLAVRAFEAYMRNRDDRHLHEVRRGLRSLTADLRREQVSASFMEMVSEVADDVSKMLGERYDRDAHIFEQLDVGAEDEADAAAKGFADAADMLKGCRQHAFDLTTNGLVRLESLVKAVGAKRTGKVLDKIREQAATYLDELKELAELLNKANDIFKSEGGKGGEVANAEMNGEVPAPTNGNGEVQVPANGEAQPPAAPAPAPEQQVAAEARVRQAFGRLVNTTIPERIAEGEDTRDIMTAIAARAGVALTESETFEVYKRLRRASAIAEARTYRVTLEEADRLLLDDIGSSIATRTREIRTTAATEGELREACVKLRHRGPRHAALAEALENMMSASLVGAR